MATQQYAASRQPTVDRDGVMTYVDRNGDTVQESSGPHIFRGLALAGGEAFVSDSEDESEEEYVPHHHHQHQPAAYIPQQMGYPRATSSSPPQYTHMMPQPERKSKKDKKSKKSKKERSGSSSSSSSSNQHHACSCGQNHH